MCVPIKVIMHSTLQ